MKMKEKTKRAIAFGAAVMSIPLFYNTANKLVQSYDGIRRVARSSAVISYGSFGDYLVARKPKEILFKLDDVGLADEKPYIVETVKPTEPVKEKPIAVKPPDAGNIIRKTYVTAESKIYVKTGEGYIKNCTDLPRETVEKTAKEAPAFKIAGDGRPEVLIMHTHATESYQDDDRDWFDKEYSFRTTDCEKNVTRVGDEAERVLKEAGIGVIHDKTLHDYPSYNGSYERSAETVKRILADNPTIKVVIDLHRDAIQRDSNTVLAPVCRVNGKNAAQLMIISGCDNGKMNMPNYLENLKFSAALQRELSAIDENLARPVLFDYRKYNQDLTTGSVLVEVGGHGNSLDEAIYSGELLGEALVSALNKLRQVKYEG